MVDMTNSTGGRAQSEVLGTVMLLGIVVMASLVVAGIAMGAFGGTQDQADREAIERTLLDFRSSAVDVAIEGETQRTMPLDLPEGAEFSMADEETSFTVEHLNYSGGGAEEVLYDIEDIGTAEVAYDGVRYGVQAGGLFSLEGDRGVLVAPPNMGYRDLTANIPLLRIDGDESMVGPTELRMSQGDHIRPAFPNDSMTYGDDRPYGNPVMDGTIRISVSGAYYEGWYQYFVQYTDGEVNKYTNNQTTVAYVESLDELDPDAGIIHYSGLTTKGNMNPDHKHADFIPDIEEVVTSRNDTAAGEHDDLPDGCFNDGELGDCTLTEGTYYFDDDIDVTGDVEINVEDGDVDIVIDGGIDIMADISVTGDENNGVVYYLDGGIDFQSGNVHTDPDPPQSHRNIFLSASDGEWGSPGSGSSDIDAVIIAPYADIDFAGNVNIRGSIWGESVTLRGNTDVVYDDGLDDQGGIDISGTQTPVMFLHLTENTVVVEG